MPLGHYVWVGLLHGVISDSLGVPFPLIWRHLYDEQLPALSLSFLQEALPDGSQVSYHPFADLGADGLPPLRPEFPAFRPAVPERTGPPAIAP